MPIADATNRAAIYRRLDRRNRLVALLRLAVPVAGALVLAVLVGQIYLSSLASRFGLGRISVAPDRITVDAPEYTGLLTDGSAYRVSASGAQAMLATPDQIELQNAALSLTRPDGDTLEANAEAAVLDTTRRQVTIAGVAFAEDSDGTVARLENSLVDLDRQIITTEGPVRIDHADGTRIVAEGLVYDVPSLHWTFTRPVVSLPDTPGAKARTP